MSSFKLVRERAYVGSMKAQELIDLIKKPEDMEVFMSEYWKEGKEPLSNQVKKALRYCLNKFSEYDLKKWNDSAKFISARDILFLTHAKPVCKGKDLLFAKIANNLL